MTAHLGCQHADFGRPAATSCRRMFPRHAPPLTSFPSPASANGHRNRTGFCPLPMILQAWFCEAPPARFHNHVPRIMFAESWPPDLRDRVSTLTWFRPAGRGGRDRIPQATARASCTAPTFRCAARSPPAQRLRVAPWARTATGPRSQRPRRPERRGRSHAATGGPVAVRWRGTGPRGPGTRPAGHREGVLNGADVPVRRPITSVWPGGSSIPPPAGSEDSTDGLAPQASKQSPSHTDVINVLV